MFVGLCHTGSDMP